MASLTNKHGRWSVQFRLRANQDRKTVALGAVSEEDAEAIRARVTILVDAYRAESPPDPSTARWVAKLGDDLHAKLAAAGLVVARYSPTAPTVPMLGPFIERYIEKRKADTGPGTRTNYGQAKGYLVDYFGATRPMDRITHGDAEDFRLDLLSRLADNTVRRVCGRAKQFFAAAIRHKLIAENPFGGMKCSIVENRERDHFVTRQEAQAILDACPDAQWRLLFALSRFGGLRCPSEHLGLRWQDIDWERARMTVRSPKTARKGKPSRLVPIFPELRKYLEEVWEQAEPGTDHIITRYRDRNSNLRTQLCRIIAKAGLVPWEKLFQNLRATRATELVSQGWPEFKVCAWLGHTEAVAKKHYWQVTEDDYRVAAGLPVAKSALQMALQISGAVGCNTVQEESRQNAVTPEKTAGCSKLQQPASYASADKLTPTGAEQPGENTGKTADSADALQMALQMVATLSPTERGALLRALGATSVQ